MLATKITFQLDIELQEQFALITKHKGPMANMHREDANYAKRGNSVAGSMTSKSAAYQPYSCRLSLKE
jgi:hypothetical protein